MGIFSAAPPAYQTASVTTSATQIYNTTNVTVGGTTYTFPNITAFLANQPSAIQYLGDISAPSVFNSGATGPRRTKQEYYVGFAQDEWRISPAVTLNYGVRYDTYSAIYHARCCERGCAYICCGAR